VQGYFPFAALATGSSQATILMHRSTDHIFACRSRVHAPAASAVPLTIADCKSNILVIEQKLTTVHQRPERVFQSLLDIAAFNK
jgi:hypothetical protein